MGCTMDPMNRMRALLKSALSRQDAIDIAIQSCLRFHLKAQEPPHNIQAMLTTLRRANDLLSSEDEYYGREPRLAAWLVTLEGTWRLYGPPPEDDQTPGIPIYLYNCTVLMDAEDGEVISVSNHQLE